jgi:hypothetical protein
VAVVVEVDIGAVAAVVVELLKIVHFPSLLELIPLLSGLAVVLERVGQRVGLIVFFLLLLLVAEGEVRV